MRKNLIARDGYCCGEGGESRDGDWNGEGDDDDWCVEGGDDDACGEGRYGDGCGDGGDGVDGDWLVEPVLGVKRWEVLVVHTVIR